MDKRKEELIKVLKEEESRLPEFNVFGESNHVEQYPLVYKYLQTGEYDVDLVDDYDLLYAVVYDLEDVFDCYGVE